MTEGTNGVGLPPVGWAWVAECSHCDERVIGKDKEDFYAAAEEHMRQAHGA